MMHTDLPLKEYAHSQNYFVGEKTALYTLAIKTRDGTHYTIARLIPWMDMRTLIDGLKQAIKTKDYIDVQDDTDPNLLNIIRTSTIESMHVQQYK